MDLVAIEDTISILEESPTTPENVSELASLYICRANLQSRLKSIPDAIESELNDILPYYTKYRDIKRRYQMHQTTEGEVIKGIKDVCRELSEFIGILYSGTDMNKERMCIKHVLSQLNEKYSD